MIAHAAPHRAAAPPRATREHEEPRDPVARHPTARRRSAVRTRADRTVGPARADRRSSTAAVVGLAVVVWIGLAMAGQPVSTKNVGFDVDGSRSVDVTFEVTKPRESTVTCTVTALSESYAEVGVRTVEVGPADAATRRVTVTVQTTELAVTGIVESCELVEEPTALSVVLAPRRSHDRGRG